MAKVLIVDDEKQTVDLFMKALTLLGHDTHAAYAGAAALSMIQREDFDLVLLDLMMPEMDGFEVLRRVRASERGYLLPVVVVTASQEADVVQRVSDAGGNAVYRKPVGLDALHDMVFRYARREAPVAIST